MEGCGGRGGGGGVHHTFNKIFASIEEVLAYM